jgi:hypothetical protein
MAVYQRNVSMSGNWVKGSDVKSGIKAKLTSETIRTESQFKNEDGTPKLQDVAKIRFEDKKEDMNIALNRATLNGLVDAFGTESKDWIGKYLTTQTERMVVGGKRVTALYLIPEGYELTEDSGGYMVVQRKNTDNLTSEGKPIPFPDEEIKPEDIPF